jgi:hypothetical protein
MIVEISPEAEEHIKNLRRFYAKKLRPEAIDKLQRNVLFISNPTNLGLASFKPYPSRYRWLKYPGVSWVQHDNYWFAFDSNTMTKASIRLVALIYGSAGYRRQQVGRNSEASSAGFGEIAPAGGAERKDGGWRCAYPPYSTANRWVSLALNPSYT